MNWMVRSNLDNWMDDFFGNASITHSYGRLYNPQTHDIVPRKEYIQKEIESLKSKKKEYKEAIVSIEKKIEEYEKRIE